MIRGSDAIIFFCFGASTGMTFLSLSEPGHLTLSGDIFTRVFGVVVTGAIALMHWYDRRRP